MAAPNHTNGKRYDRQVRLWGVHGQARLESSKVCVMGAGPMCTEALKNLVLGGIASFTIIDDKKVTEDDLKNNFFFQPDQLGAGRAESACKLLRELNDQVKGSFSDAVVEEMLQTTPNFLQAYSLVIVEQMSRTTIKILEEHCHAQNTSLIVMACQGLFASIQISGPECCIIESKPDNIPSDLRVSKPWPELQSLADSIDLETCDDITHKHTPWALLLIKAVKAWRDQHGTEPSSAAERRQFKELLRGWQHTIDGIPVEEENFTEAVRQAHTAWMQPTVPKHVLELFLDESCTHLTASSSSFWILVAALKSFTENEGDGALPLEGSIPDMTATTDLFLALQRVYRARADAHCAAVLAHAHAALKALGRSAGEVKPEDVRLFCRNARHLRVVRRPRVVRPLADMHVDCLRRCFDTDEQSNEAAAFLALHAADAFRERHHRAPGAAADTTEWEHDVTLLQQAVVAAAAEMGLPASAAKRDILQEFCRAAGPTMHTAAAVVGGIAAQEALKTILQQFVPLDGVLVYNGIHACSAVFRV
eukprot:jgi/Ulvmu1/10720/UM068_0005.1